MKLFCRGNHWKSVNGQLLLSTPTGKDETMARQVVDVLRAQVRLEIYEAICNFKVSENRKTIMKYGNGNMDNAMLAIQSICADIALGTSIEQKARDKNERTVTIKSDDNETNNADTKNKNGT